MVVLLGVHSIVYTYFIATAKWAGEVVRVYQLPDWFVAQAKRNKRRAFRFIMGSMTAIAITAWLGAAADTRGSAFSPWHLGCRGAHLAFNFGSFASGLRRDRGPCPPAARAQGPGRRAARGAATSAASAAESAAQA